MWFVIAVRFFPTLHHRFKTCLESGQWIVVGLQWYSTGSQDRTAHNTKRRARVLVLLLPLRQLPKFNHLQFIMHLPNACFGCITVVIVLWDQNLRLYGIRYQIPYYTTQLQTTSKPPPHQQTNEWTVLEWSQNQSFENRILATNPLIWFAVI